MARAFTIGQAKTQLAKLVALAERGEEVGLRRAGPRCPARPDRRAPVQLPADTRAVLWWLELASSAAAKVALWCPKRSMR